MLFPATFNVFMLEKFYISDISRGKLLRSRVVDEGKRNITLTS